MSWNKLTLPKSVGGLGFREIEQFNDALLAKVAWRIIKNPESLLSQILTSKYCHSTPFMEASIPMIASHGWRSILAGREVLKRGAGWIVGDGRQISVWRDPWLSTATPQIPIGPPTAQNQDLMVADLIDPASGDWNIPAIRSHLPQYEDTIRLLIPSVIGMQDTLVWLPEKRGSYSTKSGYALTKLNVEPAVNPGLKWNQCIWQARTSPKLKNFLWRVGNRALRVGANLLAKGMEVDGSCKRCGAVETELHVLLHCPFASRVWDLVPAANTPSIDRVSTVPQLLQSSQQLVNLPPTGLNTSHLLPWIVWNLWTARNKVLFEGRAFTEQEVVSKAVGEARVWQAAQDAIPKAQAWKKPVTVPPSIATAGITCFVDAAWRAGNREAGFGWRFVDGNGSSRDHFANRCNVSSALMAETLAVKTALAEAVVLGHGSLLVKSDSKSLVEFLNSSGRYNELQEVVHDILVLCKSFESVSFVYIPRLCNREADSLAKQGF